MCNGGRKVEELKNLDAFWRFGGVRDLPRLTPENGCHTSAWDSIISVVFYMLYIMKRHFSSTPLTLTLL